MLNFRDIFGSYFSSFFNFVFQFSQNLSVRIWRISLYQEILSLSRSGNSQITQGLDVHMSFLGTRPLYVGQKFWKFSWKNDFSQIDPGSIWDGSWITRASKNIHLSALEASGITKNMINLKKVINSKIGQENEEIR